MISTLQRNVKLAKQHTVSSNEHDINAITQMLAEDATYSSPQVGDLQGRESILEAMEGLFRELPDVKWGTDGYLASGNEVTFHFAMRATKAATGQAIYQDGTGTVTLSDDGLITRVAFKE